MGCMWSLCSCTLSLGLYQLNKWWHQPQSWEITKHYLRGRRTLKHWPHMWKYESQEEGEQSVSVAVRVKGWFPVKRRQQYKERTTIHWRKEKAEKSDSIMQELPNDCWNVGLCDGLLEGVAQSLGLSCFSLSLPSWPPNTAENVLPKILI